MTEQSIVADMFMIVTKGDVKHQQTNKTHEQSKRRPPDA
jgi:hypothetical protein